MTGVNLVVLAKLLGVGTWIPRGAVPRLSQAVGTVLCSSCCNSSLERSFLQIWPTEGMVLKFPPSAITLQKPQAPAMQSPPTESRPLTGTGTK